MDYSNFRKAQTQGRGLVQGLAKKDSGLTLGLQTQKVALASYMIVNS